MTKEISEYAALLNSQGLEILIDVLQGEATSEGTDRMFLRLFDSQGHVLGTTSMHAWPTLELSAAHIDAARTDTPLFETIDATASGPPTRVVTAQLRADVGLQMGVSMQPNDEILNTFRRVLVGGLLVIVPLSVAGGWVMLRGALSRVEQVTRTASNIARGDLSQRVPISGYHDEIADLANAFNRMLEHNERLIKSLKEVSDDIAHDLRGPITRIRGTAEVALNEAGRSPAHSAVLGSIVEDCDGLLALINTMLEISETEAGLALLSTSEFDLIDLVSDVTELFSPAAEDKGLLLEVRARDEILFCGDPQRLRRAVVQLIDNAIKYTDAGGKVTVEVAQEDFDVRIAVTDTGVGIRPAHAQAIFSRFYRADESRSQPGNGLGLSLAQAIVQAHRGTISVTSTPGAGSTFTIALPSTGVTKGVKLA